MHMDEQTRAFIEHSTLLFVVSRNADGKLDVSPRGGQPGVLTVARDGRLLLPDYRGNNRLDTIGNILGDPVVALALLRKGSDAFLKILATASVSTEAADLAEFPADENRPVCVIVLEPTVATIVESDAFEKAGFWIDPELRKPPLDILAILRRQTEQHLGTGHKPVMRDEAGEQLLVLQGLRSAYGVVEPVVRRKSFNVIGSESLRFLVDARFAVIAYNTHDNEIDLQLVGRYEELLWEQDRPELALRLDGVGSGAFRPGGELGILAVEPGRCENLRINGTVALAQDPLSETLHIAPEEIFCHCSSAFSRSRIWHKSQAPIWTGRRTFNCVALKQEARDVMSFVLEPRDKAALGSILPGQYVTVSLPAEGRSSPQRSYSVSGRIGERRLRITVRRAGRGGVSDSLHDQLSVGSTLLVGPPKGRFVVAERPTRPVVLVSVGVGLTPLLPMLDHLVQNDPCEDIWFIHGARSGQHHALKDETRRLADICRRAKLFTVYSQPADQDILGRDYDRCGHVDADTVATLVDVADVDFYICGPEAFMTSLSDRLVALGASPHSIKREIFTGSAMAATPRLGASGLSDRTVRFSRTGMSVLWSPKCGSLLDLALASGIDVPHSCRVGECLSCLQRLVRGSVQYPDDAEIALDADQVLLCQAWPKEDTVIEI